LTTTFHKADPAKILLACGLKKCWRIKVGPYILTLTKNVEPTSLDNRPEAS
jgi:hypothetical protein